jgi:hypothetical protein
MSGYYLFVFKPRQDYSVVLLQACLESFDLKNPVVNIQFFGKSISPSTGIWACEDGAKNYKDTGTWQFSK